MAVVENSVHIPQFKINLLLINPITGFISNLNNTGMSKKDNLFRLATFSVPKMWNQPKHRSVTFSVAVIKFADKNNVK